MSGFGCGLLEVECSAALHASRFISGTLCNNTAYFLPTDDTWVLAAANAPITWWFAWRRAVHGKDEALRFIKEFVQDLPIPLPPPEQRQAADATVRRLIEITSRQHQT